MVVGETWTKMFATKLKFQEQSLQGFYSLMLMKLFLRSKYGGGIYPKMKKKKRSRRSAFLKILVQDHACVMVVLETMCARAAHLTSNKTIPH